MKGELLLEIGTEELPARFVAPALEAMRDAATRLLEEAAVACGEIRTFGTPRRLTLLATGLAGRQADRRREVTGPPASVAFDAEGKPTRAAEGFARSQGVPLERLEVRRTDRGEYVTAVIEEKGEAVSKILPGILSDLVTGLAFPKSMRWGRGRFRFARPVHWIAALHDGVVVPFEVDGIRSGDRTRGHRFLAPGEFALQGGSAYLEDLRTRFVVADRKERRDLIRREATRLAAELGGRLVDDGELLETVTDLVEYPTPLLGRFEERYLELPRELLVTVMKGHQKYFAVEAEDGRLLPGFVVVSNMTADQAGTVIRGNERVLRARLEDARFYFEDDRGRSLDSRVEDLKAVTFQEKLGSVHDKMERVTRIAAAVADRVAPDRKEEVARAARLAKADLTTGVVYEFPELQGYMGMIYARHDGEKDEVAAAVWEHYRPRYSGDGIPETPTGAVVALADKIDSIAAFFSIGLVPTGSEDPYALRRAALGILAVLEGKDFDLPLEELIDLALRELPGARDRREPLASEIAAFFRGRLQRLLAAEGHPHDLVEAVLAGPVGRLPELRRRLSGLLRLRAGEGWGELVTAAKRVANILARAPETEPDERLLESPEEKGLLEAARRAGEGLRPEAPEGLHDLVGPINGFFDAVLVMDEREDVRRSRLGLLREVHRVFARVADFSKIVE